MHVLSSVNRGVPLVTNMEVLKCMTLLLTVSVYLVNGEEAVQTAEVETKPEVLKPIPLARQLSASPVDSALQADSSDLTPVNRDKRTLLLGKALAFGKGVLVGKAIGGFGHGGYGGHYYGGHGYGGYGHGGYHSPSYGHCCGGGYYRPSYGGWGGSGSFSHSQASSYGGGWGGGSFSSSSAAAGSYGWGK